jgi:carbamoyl-phosphate synthase large subunit
MLSVGYTIPEKNILLSTGDARSTIELFNSSRMLFENGYKLFASPETHQFLEANGIESEQLFLPDENKSPNIIDFIKSKKIDLVINIPKSLSRDVLNSDYQIRRTAVDFNVPLVTNSRLASAFIYAFCRRSLESLSIKSWQEF